MFFLMCQEQFYLEAMLLIIQNYTLHTWQGWGSGFGQKTGSGALYLKRREVLKVHWMNILDDSQSLLFWFHTFYVRRTIDVLDSEN